MEKHQVFKNNGGKKKRESLNCFLWDVAFMQHCLTWVPLFQKFKCFFCLSPTKLEFWDYIRCWKAKVFVFNWKATNGLCSIVQPLSWQTINFNRSKTAQTGFEEISKTSINKAPFLPFSNPFVTLRSYRVPMESFWLQNDMNSCSIACRNRDFKW